MRYERPRQGDAIAAPIHRWFDRENGNYEGFGGQSWDQVDRWSNRTNAGLAPVKEGIRHSQPVRALYSGYRGQAKDGSAAWHAENEHTNFVCRATWRTSTTSILAGLWSRILRQRETRRIKAAWEMIDDQTLKDIGISRYEIERARDARYWS
jgi:uncharacterized protein YjiS (DUF1127 family)